MSNVRVIAISSIVLLGAGALVSGADTSGPCEGEKFKGRIAWSADGNHNDPDDWIASPVALAIFAECGHKDRLVHFDYNCILPQTEPAWEKIHADSVLGAVERYGYDKSRFHDCRKDLDAALASIAKAIDDSSADNPLYFIVAGPMEVPFRGIQKSDPEKRKFVYCISHSRWNEGYQRGYAFTNTKRSVIASGINWVQIRDQNRLLARGKFGQPSTAEEEWQIYHWMRDSHDSRVRFLWDRMQVSTRPDPSDAGMAYFLMTGDEEADPQKLRRLLDDHVVPRAVGTRRYVRLEAENFRTFEGYELEDRNDKMASHRLNVKLTRDSGLIRTPFNEPYTAQGARYDVEVRYFDEGQPRFRLALLVNGASQGVAWESSGVRQGWVTETIRDVKICIGDEIAVEARGAAGRLDFVQLNAKAALVAKAAPAADRKHKGPTISNPGGELDEPDALPGQIIVAGANPGYLKYNGGGPAFLCGPDNPEEFLYMGTLNADGTRSGGGQDDMIDRMVKAGVNAFHCQIFRMRRCNFKKEGDDTHCPFVNHDPAQPLNEKILDQWEGWLSELERHGINVHFEFYNDATDVEAMGWVLDQDGNLPADERRMIVGIVERFKHHKNLLWGIEESCNKLPLARSAHFKKIGELIAETDDHHHPIVQSFVIPGDPEGDLPEGGFATEAYEGDPNIRVVTWLHVRPNSENYARQHEEYLGYYRQSGRKFVTMKNETYDHPRRGTPSRRYMWSCAMAGMHTLEAYHILTARKTPAETLADDGRINRFLEQTDFHAMQPHDELAAGSTKWVLACPGESYIAYTFDYTGPMGVRNINAGTYDLHWFDTAAGTEVLRPAISVSAGDAVWSKPESIGNEPVLYIKRRNSPSQASAQSR